MPLGRYWHGGETGAWSSTVAKRRYAIPAEVLSVSKSLHHAVGKPDELRVLIAAGVPLEERDEDGCTALFMAAFGGG